MIPLSAIQQWRDVAPWGNIALVEQDLIISRSLIAIFGDDFLSTQLAFRGGTALHNLYLSPAARYSEDIDLVQINPAPIKPILKRLGEVLDFIPDRVIKQKRYNNTMLCRINSEGQPFVQLRLKIEINCYEHFTELGYVKLPFSVQNQWFSGKSDITTYQLEELLGTKLRALYQRRKGRDLLDLYLSMKKDVNLDDVIRCYKRYISFTSNQPPTQKQFLRNMEEKMQTEEFLTDSAPILRPGIAYNPLEAYELVRDRLLNKL